MGIIPLCQWSILGNWMMWGLNLHFIVSLTWTTDLKKVWWPPDSHVTRTSFIIDKTVWNVDQQQENFKTNSHDLMISRGNKLKAKKMGFSSKSDMSDNFSPAFSEWRQAEDEEIIGLLNEINDVQYNELHISETSAARSAQQESLFLTLVYQITSRLFKKNLFRYFFFFFCKLIEATNLSRLERF